jgi:hypothetical protein
MSIKQIISLTTIAGANEQSAASPITVVATGNSHDYGELASFNRAMLFLDVSAIAGAAPSVVVGLQVQDPQSGKWSSITAATFPAQTAVTGGTPITPLTSELYGLNHRLLWTFGGTTTSITFQCCAVAGCEEPWS